MELIRTANAGVLLKLDGVSILLDGVCREVKPYLATPPELRSRLSACWPDVLAFTHAHEDHYDPEFAASFRKQTNGVVLGPEELTGCHAVTAPHKVGAVTVTPIRSRHIGKVGQTVRHFSFILQGTACVWFLGDASPVQWRGREELPRPDVLIVPYAYAATQAAWELTRQLGAQSVVLLHMPQRDADPSGIWPAVQDVTAGLPGPQLHIPEMGERLSIDKFPNGW